MFKSIKNFFYYKNVLKQHREELLRSYNVRIDMISRMYTVYTMDETEFLQYGEPLFTSNLKTYKMKLDKYLIDIGLSELYGIYLEERVNDRQLKLGLRYKYIDTLLWANIFLIGFVSILVGLGLGIMIKLIN